MSGRSPYLPFQVLQLARKIAFTVFIALSQLGPLLHEPTATGQLNSDALQQRQLNRLANAVKLADQETHFGMVSKSGSFKIRYAQIQPSGTPLVELWLNVDKVLLLEPEEPVE
ncbi:MAG: hypothetical protein Q9157_002521 [Trypethelium eluteriae]